MNGYYKRMLDDYIDADDLYADVDVDDYIRMRRNEFMHEWDQMMSRDDYEPSIIFYAVNIIK